MEPSGGDAAHRRSRRRRYGALAALAVLAIGAPAAASLRAARSGVATASLAVDADAAGAAASLGRTPDAYQKTACKSDCNCTAMSVPVLNGLDVVSPFHGNLLSGDAAYATTYKGYEWRFANAINLNAFLADPGRYEPRYGGFCAYGLATEFEGQGFSWTAENLGPPVDTAVYRIYNDYLYFFMAEDVVTKFAESDLDRSIALADARWRGWFPEWQAERFNTRCMCTLDASGAPECMWRR